MDTYKCNICDVILNNDDLKLFKINCLANSIGKVLVCKTHWCNCMPLKKPSRWIKICFKCKNNTYCSRCCIFSINVEPNVFCYECSKNSK